MAQKVITILEARVTEENWAALQANYEKAKDSKPPRPLESYLAQSEQDPTLWRIITVWENMGILEKMRSSGETPAGVLVFKNAGAEPTLTIFGARKYINFQ